MGAKPFEIVWKTSQAPSKKPIDLKHFPFSPCNNLVEKKKCPSRHLTLNLGFVIQQVLFPLLGSNIIVEAVEEILLVVIFLFTKAVNDTKQGF